ncbi:MAG: hypothetical protein CM15mP51_08650 [Porticoccaceae bacterium]|nr:MAG: hypothetical protein CM15mP51_08650 [Porticoccaceae bacterium]
MYNYTDFFIALASCSDYPSVTSVYETPEVDTKGDAQMIQQYGLTLIAQTIL